jgi:hypothetical protein
MSAHEEFSPPFVARLFLRSLLPRGVRGEAIRGDLDEEFVSRCRRTTKPQARAWYRRQAFAVVVRVRLARASNRSHRDSGPHGSAPFWAHIIDDVRYGGRRLRKNSVFTLIALATIAIGIGANTTIFSVLNAVLLKPLPYPEPNRIVQFWETNPTIRAERGLDYEDMGVNALNYLEYESRTTSFDAMGFASPYRDVGVAILGGGIGATERVDAWSVSPGFFEVFGAAPVLGRSFLPEERSMGSSYVWTPVAVLSHEMWMRRFGGIGTSSEARFGSSQDPQPWSAFSPRASNSPP